MTRHADNNKLISSNVSQTQEECSSKENALNKLRNVLKQSAKRSRSLEEIKRALM